MGLVLIIPVPCSLKKKTRPEDLSHFVAMLYAAAATTAGSASTSSPVPNLPAGSSPAACSQPQPFVEGSYMQAASSPYMPQSATCVAAQGKAPGPAAGCGSAAGPTLAQLNATGIDRVILQGAARVTSTAARATAPTQAQLQVGVLLTCLYKAAKQGAMQHLAWNETACASGQAILLWG